MAERRFVRFRYLAFGIPALLLAGSAGLAAFPWAMLKGTVESRLTHTIGRPVSIGSMERLDTLSFHPQIRLKAVRIPQPVWVDASLADMAQVAQVDLSFSVWSLLTGHLSVERAYVQGASLQLYRNAQGRENWNDKQEGGRNKDRHAAGDRLRMLRVADSRLHYLDQKRDRSLDVTIASDTQGLRVDGTGLIGGHPVRVTARGAPILEGQSGPWPYNLQIEGPAVGFALTGTMPAPLDLNHLEGQARGHTVDLKLLDAIIEAGLPGTQPVRLTARIRRNWPDWTIESMTGTIGRSDIAGHATIVRRDGRSRITGALSSDHFDFDDLSNDEGKRRGAALAARLGPRILPPSAIDLSHVRQTDGALDLRVDHLLWPEPTPFRNMKGRLTLEQSRLEISSLNVGMTHGTLAGNMVVDQTDSSRKDPKLTLNLTMRGGRLLDFFPRAQVDGSLIGRMSVKGRGPTLRDAIGGGDGVIALVGRDGRIPAQTAALLGQDIGRGITKDKDETASLRCLVVRLDLRGGIATPSPIVIDSSQAQSQVRGSIDLHKEQLMLSLKGAPKEHSLLRLPGEVTIGGTIKAPAIHVPPRIKSVGGVINMVASAIAGRQDPLAGDADCNALQRRALR